ncbi:MAG TPA: single-stranded DNA-binding protein [Thermomicrobiaceae bacterium]|nr:single-stranded DNA-binding protein [Thermomicrobiaceae bacterium]
MSRGLNKIMLIGHVGREPEMRYTPSGKPVTEFSLAVNRRRRGAEGEAADETDWFRIIAWDRLAEIVDQYVTKGRQVYVEGRLQIRRYTDREGQERTAVEVVANDLQMLGPRMESTGSGGGREPSDEKEFEKDEFDDVPF